MRTLLAGLIAAAVFVGFGFVIGQRLGAPSEEAAHLEVGSLPSVSGASEDAVQPAAAQPQSRTSSDAATGASAAPSAASSGGGQSAGPKVYSQAELLALAGTDFADGRVPLGDYRYVTSGPKKGYVYLCNARKDNPGAMVDGPWISGEYWNFLQKISVQGKVSWPNASFKNVVSGSTRTLTTNALPVSHTTGTFPVGANDPARAYDRNPNSISTQSLAQSLPKDPVYLSSPNCMGGEAGIMLTGVPLFNAFDAGLRDAPAHELQDSCDGHPQGSGEYHYHSLSACMNDVSVSTVLGYAYDGFPITGPMVADGKYLTTEDLDECHGLTSEVVVDGAKKVTYHYVMTRDFPYSVSCFRGASHWSGPAGGNGMLPRR